MRPINIVTKVTFIELDIEAVGGNQQFLNQT